VLQNPVRRWNRQPSRRVSMVEPRTSEAGRPMASPAPTTIRHVAGRPPSRRGAAHLDRCNLRPPSPQLPSPRAQGCDAS
jgi:hypothetical protein